jgi:hypothetical protein
MYRKVNLLRASAASRALGDPAATAGCPTIC